VEDDTTEGAGRGIVAAGRIADLEVALVERVRERRSARALAPLTIVVGSAPVRTRVGDFLVRRLGAVANVSTVTLSRFATDVVTAARGAPPCLLGAAGRERMVRRLVAGDGATKLRYFGRVATRPHFARALTATFDDLREAGVPAGAGWASCLAGDEPTASPAKAGDLRTLYAAYCAELQRLGVSDRAGLYLEAARAVGEAADALGGERCLEPAGSSTILYGIYDLNEAQEAFATVLLRAGADAFVPLPRAVDERLATVLTAARRAGADVRRLTPPPAARDSELAGVCRRPEAGARDPARPFAGDGSLVVVSVADERVEAREAARAVVSAAEVGVALWDCAVVVPHGDDVERVASALVAAGLPVACRLPDRSAGPRVVARLLECLAPATGEPFARRAVVDLLSAAPLRAAGATAQESALWLDEARRAGIVSGTGQWTERLARRRADLVRAADEAARGGGLAGADDDEERVTGASAAPRLAAVRALEHSVGDLVRTSNELPTLAAWRGWVVAVSNVVDAVFDEATAASARDVVGRLMALDVLGEEVDLDDVATVLREQSAAASVPEGRVGRTGVAVLTPLELRGLSFHTVVFTGLAEGGFPARGRPDPILGDAARRRIGEDLRVRLPLADDRESEAWLLFALACDAARERIVLVAPRTDAATGRPRLPSRVLLHMASSAAGHPVGLGELLGGEPLLPVWRRAASAVVPAGGTEPVWADVRERDVGMLLALDRPGDRDAALAYLTEVLGDGDEAGRRLRAWRAGRSPEPGAWDGLLGGEARAALASRRVLAAELHPTRLERYLRCPFTFLLRDILGLAAPDEPGATLDMEARELGTLVHAILEKAYARVMTGQGQDDAADGGPSLDEMLRALDGAWQEGCAEAERRGVTGAALAWEVRRRLLLDDLREAVRRDPVFAAGEGRPHLVEWRFGEELGRPVSLDLEGGVTVRFAGRLDRVDTAPWGARVIDYKAGRGTTEGKILDEGLSVQLPVYQLALRQAGERDVPEITCAYRFVTRRGGFGDEPLREDEAASAARLRRLLSRITAFIETGVFARSTGGTCDHCDVAYACGLSRWARSRKRRHPALAALVELQRGRLGEEGGDGVA